MNPHANMPPLCEQSHTVIDLERIRRVAMMITPNQGGTAIDQAWEALAAMRAILQQQSEPMQVTSQTIFLKNADDADVCRHLFRAYFGEKMPATNYIVQPPCGGQALAIEAWAVGGEGVEIDFAEPDVVSISYDGLRWVYVVGVTPPSQPATAYEQSLQTFHEMNQRLERSQATFRDVVRKWLYQGSITEEEAGVERYRELNRARTDLFDELAQQEHMPVRSDGTIVYPASTGIGKLGHGLTMSCMTLQTDRKDVRLLPLENPQQTSAFQYAKRFSEKSPKFSRAMAVVIGGYVTTWISGTASIVDSETVYPGDVAKQTEQTIDNIQNLISPGNFAQHGVQGAGAQLKDLAKVRVYIKRAEDYPICREICERRFGPLPAIYAQADVCRSNLLVEIEGVAFSRLN